MPINAVTYIIMSTKVWSNTISIFVCLATLLYITEKAMNQKDQLGTYNERLVVLLVFFCMMASIANINVPVSTKSCHLNRHYYAIIYEHFL